MSEPSSAVDLESAQSALDQLMAQVGVDGLVAAIQRPGLLAVVDQHAAAVRDSLASAGRPVDAVSLARYATLVTSIAHRSGYAVPDVTTLDWSRADWYLLRLVAICALADAGDCF